MSQPEHEAIINEIQTAQIAASPELRARVRAIAAQSPAAPSSTPPRRRELPWRRGLLIAAPAALAVVLAGTLAIGLADSGSSERDAAREREPTTAFTGPGRSNGGGAGEADDSIRPTAPAPAQQAQKATSTTLPFSAGNLPSTPGRAQLYDAELTLKVKDLSTATKRALRMTRDFHGYVRSVEYGSGAESGSAYMVLRVPIGSVQEAIVDFSELGTITDQQVSIQDVQPTVDKRFRLMQAHRDEITRIQAKLKDQSLSTTDRVALENQLVAAQHELVLLQKQAAALARQTSFATVELDLQQGEKAVVLPHDPGRIGRALDRSAEILVDEAKVVLYVLIVGAPFFILAAFLIGGVRMRRRRDESRLLATS